MNPKKIVFIVSVLLLFTANIFAQTDTSAVKCWIVFSDKNGITQSDNLSSNEPAYELAKQQITERALQRRLKTLPKDEAVQFGDLPVDAKYIDKVSGMGIKIIAKSRWLNGVSAYVYPEQIEMLKKLDFVSRIFAVKKLYKQRFPDSSQDYSRFLPVITADSLNRYDYGKSLTQMTLVNVPPVHNLGITGRGVLVASLDDGFEWKTHEALKNLKIIGEYDFINEDNNTAREENQRYKDENNQGGHGTATLSSMAGFMEGKLIGPAFNAEFLLAKTEYTATETPMEEDFWLEAAEWVESQGADVITSSLVYKTFDNPYVINSYVYNDFDGKTCITSIAGDMAAHLGVVVCNATGNYNQTDPPSLGSASDGDSVIGVGAVNTNGKIASFSSNGPTSDGRIKPDVVAPGVSVYVARMGSGNKYEYSNGTSFATPITAGVCALILSAHPELTAMQVRDALRNTANNSQTPNNIYGYGLINALKAVLYFGPVWSNDVKVDVNGGEMKIAVSFAANDIPNANCVKLFYKTKSAKKYKEKVMTLSKELNDLKYAGEYTVTLKTDETDYYFSYSDGNGVSSTGFKK
ncbi:MAG: S8 family serine peptidase [Bacteroidetes bacterium]|nr:S8 family serine peptidase [Bacteroidota bacterium]